MEMIQKGAGSLVFKSIRPEQKQSYCQNETIEGGPFGEKIFPKKSRNAEKTEKGTFWPRLVLYVTRETFLVPFLGPAGTVWRLLKILYNFGRTILVTSGVSKII